MKRSTGTITRRAFSASVASMVALGASPFGGHSKSTAAAAPLRRPIPKTGERLPVIGMGSWLTFGIQPGDKAALENDLAEGYVTQEGAAREYGKP